MYVSPSCLTSTCSQAPCGDASIFEAADTAPAPSSQVTLQATTTSPAPCFQATLQANTPAGSAGHDQDNDTINTSPATGATRSASCINAHTHTHTHTHTGEAAGEGEGARLCNVPPKRQKTDTGPRDVHRTGAKAVPSGPQDTLHKGVGYHVFGVLRTKPGTNTRNKLPLLCTWGAQWCVNSVAVHMGP